MYCKHCGKQLSDEAILCPDCGTPTGVKPRARVAQRAGEQADPLGTIALFLSIFSFVTGIVFGAFFYTYAASVILLYILGASTILPALAAVCLGIAVLYREEKERDRLFAIVSIVLAGVVLFFLFIAGCIIASGSL